MTAQLSDIYYYRGEEYNIVAMENQWPFDISSLGVSPVPPHSACWNGYFCEYSIGNDELLLMNLQVCLKDEYPEINGVKAVENPKQNVILWGMKKYEEINIPVKYSGGLVVAKGFMDKYYVHMGYQQPYAYREVYELILEDGKMVKQINRSDDMARIREELEKDAGKHKPYDLEKSIEIAFSLDYKDKWL